MVTDQIAIPNKPETFEFTGRRGPFFQLLLINLLLTILTLGIYRFWAKTKIRKFIWSNIRFMGDPLEYTGKPTELLLGFLIVLAVLFPLGLIFNAIQFLVPPSEFWLRFILQIIYYLVLFALIQVGFYKAWRYRMSRTAWRGIRLGLDGSTWAYLKISAGWTVLTILSLGIAYPWMVVELWRYQITHTRIGETTVSFSGSGRDLILPWMIVQIPVILVLISFGLSIYFSGNHAEIVSGEFFQSSKINLAAGVLLIIAAIGYPALIIAGFWFSLKLTRYQISGISINEAFLKSRLPFGRLLAFAALALSVFVVPAIILGILNVITSSLTSDGIIILAIVGFFVAFIILPIAWTLIFTFELVKQLFITATVTNPETLEHVIQSAATSQKTGEGLADALDIGGL